MNNSIVANAADSVAAARAAAVRRSTPIQAMGPPPVPGGTAFAAAAAGAPPPTEEETTPLDNAGYVAEEAETEVWTAHVPRNPNLGLPHPGFIVESSKLASVQLPEAAFPLESVFQQHM